MEQGSFNWYLFRSGGFVTTIAEAIQRADSINLGKLQLIYPQMVSAFQLENWDFPPEGFKIDTYNSELK